MHNLALLIDEHIDWIARNLNGDSHAPDNSPGPQAPAKETAPADVALVEAIQRLTRLILEQRPRCSPVPDAPSLPDDAAMAREADRIVEMGRERGLTGLLLAAKGVRRRVLELVLWSDIEPEQQTCERRAAIAAYDQIELLLAQAWERDERTPPVALGEAQVLQAMHYPVLIVDMAERIRWMNDAAMTLWRALPVAGPDEPRPIFVDEMVPDLALPWDSIVDQESGWASRASFDQQIETRTGTREMTISAWPLPVAPGATPTLALFLLDQTA